MTARQASRPATGADGWRPGRAFWVAAGACGLVALVGLAAGISGAAVLGGLAVMLAAGIGLIRPAWVGARRRSVAGIAAGAGLAVLTVGAFAAPATPVAAPVPATTPTTANSSSPPSAPASPAISVSPSPSGTLPTSVQARPSPTGTGATIPAPAAGTALAALEKLPVKGRAPKTGYSRDQFGSGWARQPDGCTTRQAVLRRDLADVKVLASDECVIMGGKLNDPYTGAAFTAKTTSMDDLEADHVVPVADAWQKGAQQLPASRREAFYNDLLNLQTTTGSVNASKRDGDAATWLPPHTDYRCAYVARQIAVKTKYKLWVTQAEKAAMHQVLARCPDQKLPTEASAHQVKDRKPTLVSPKPKPSPTPTKPHKPANTADPRFPTCKAANAAGYGPYYHDQDPEYDWYIDRDRDGVVCER